MKTLKGSIGLLILAVLAVADMAFGAVPALIGSITEGIDEPTRVAEDARGNVYVSETEDGIVYKYDSTGSQVGYLRVPRPYGVAVSATGEIYVGSMQVPSKANNYVNKSAVFVFSPDLVKTGTLGAAEGEFGAPVDIAVGADGRIYVSDMKTGVVKVFTSQGTYSHSIGSGHLRPTWTQGVAVNDSANGGAGEVYVVDSVQAYVQGYPVDVPRISVFTKSGALLRTFGQYGSERGKMISPRGIAVDRDGLLYVADSGNNVVHILNVADGSPVGEGGLYASGGFRPGGVAVSRSNVAHVAWQSGRVDAFGLDGYVTMSPSPGSLVFASRQYGGNPPAQDVTITNDGTGILNWSASANQAWILPGGSAPAGPAGSAVLTVGVDASTLAPGSYQGTVTITSEFGQVADIGIDLTVAQPLMLNISNWSPVLTAREGVGTVSESVVFSIDGGEGSWSLDTSALPSWLGISPVTGTAAPTTVLFTADPAGLIARPDPYLAEVPVTAPGVVGDGGKVTVRFYVNATTSLTVITNRPDATFQLSGPASLSGSGKQWGVRDVPAGDYTVTFGSVAGYRTPPSETKTLIPGGAVSFSGEYVSFREIASKNNIIVARGPGALDDARLKIYRNNGAPVPFDLVALETLYGASVAAGDVDGDGTDDVIVGAGKGPGNPAKVRVYRAFDKAMMAEFVPFGTLNGAGVAAADLNGDGKAEIIVSDNTGTIAVFTASAGAMVPTGIDLAGTAAAAADLEGDGLPEVVTATGEGLKVWTIGSEGPAGSWTALQTYVHAIAASSVAAADTDGDGRDEILAGIDGAAGAPSSVVIVEGDGGQTAFSIFDAFGVVVAGADLDGDGKAEIIAGAGAAKAGIPGVMAAKPGKRRDDRPGAGNREEGSVRIYSPVGALQYVIRAFDAADKGVSVAVGALGR